MLQNSLGDVLGCIPPQPKFELWQPVRSHDISEDYQRVDDTGFVIGYFYSPGINHYGFDSGWFCVVCWLSMPNDPHMPVPYVEEIRQDELRAL